MAAALAARTARGKCEVDVELAKPNNLRLLVSEGIVKAKKKKQERRRDSYWGREGSELV